MKRTRRVETALQVFAILMASCGSSGGSEDAGRVDGTGDAVDSIEAVEDTAVEDPVVEDTIVEDTVAEDGVDSPVSGEFLLLTYNVAGLPEGISGSNPAEYIPQISPLLNGYDLVLVQEDFWYHDELRADAEHPFESLPVPAVPTLTDMGDGLNRFAILAFGALERFAWVECNGTIDCSSDCLTPKGFSVATHTLADGATLDVYNLHMDAGSCAGDLSVRGVQVDQLIAEVLTRSAGRAVIVAGDTNLSEGRPDDMVVLDGLLEQLSLKDACRTLGCGDERLDRVMFRGSDSLVLTAIEWETPPEFVDPGGNDLSDHLPVAVHFEWQAN